MKAGSAERRRRAWLITTAAFSAAVLAAIAAAREALAPLLAAFALAYAVNPLVDRLEKRGWPRGRAALSVVLLMAATVGGLMYLIIPPMVRESAAMAKEAPDALKAAARAASTKLERWGIHVPASTEGLAEKVKDRIKDPQGGAALPVSGIVRRFFAGAKSALGAFVSILIVPVLTFYLLRNFKQIRYKTLELVPPAHRSRFVLVLGKIDLVLSGYIRGQLMVASILAAAFATALPLIGVRYGLIIGAVSGFLNIIPYVGQWLGCAAAATLAAIDGGWERAAMVVGVFAGANYLDNTFLTPRVVGDRAGLTPVQAITALVVGGHAAGFLGMLLAVPTTAVLKVLLLELLAAYRKSPLYRAPHRSFTGSRTHSYGKPGSRELS